MIRRVMFAGTSITNDCQITVPAGKTGYLLKVTPYFPKNQDGRIRAVVQSVLNDSTLTVGNLPFYQNAFDIDFTNSPFTITEKADLRFSAISTNAGPIEVSLIYELVLVDNDL